MNQEPLVFMLQKQLIFLSTSGGQFAMAAGGHIALASGGQFKPVTGGQFAWIFQTAFANTFWLAFCALLGFTLLISGYLVITVFFPYCFTTNCFPICPLIFRNNKLLVLCAICSGLSTSKLIFQAGKCKHPSFILRLSFVYTGSNSPVCRQVTA